MLSLENDEIDEKLQAEVRRLSGLRGYPSTAPARTELKRALANAKSIDHAARAVGRLLETALWCPAPAELRQAVEGTPSEPPVSAYCDQCGGSGWYHRPMGNSTHGVMVCCHCSAGDLKRDTLRASGSRVMGGRG